MKTNLFLIAMLFSSMAFAQTVSTFEDFNLQVDTFLNGSDGNGDFTDENLSLPNDYDAQWGSWSGFSISTMTDVTTAGFTNQYSSISGDGNNNSDTYAVGFMYYPDNDATVKLLNEDAGETVNGMYVNNSTYAYLSMRDGDAVAKKFGGATGDDQDFFLLTIKKYLNGVLSTEKVEFYLADFRFSDNSLDYIIDEWTYVDLSSLGDADSLHFQMTSSDVGQFGMNTPAYFCIDDFNAKDITAIKQVDNLDLSFYPNPVSSYLVIENNNSEANFVAFYDLNGKKVAVTELEGQSTTVDFSHLSSGLYKAVFQTKSGDVFFQNIVKK